MGLVYLFFYFFVSKLREIGGGKVSSIIQDWPACFYFQSTPLTFIDSNCEMATLQKIRRRPLPSTKLGAVDSGADDVVGSQFILYLETIRHLSPHMISKTQVCTTASTPQKTSGLVPCMFAAQGIQLHGNEDALEAAVAIIHPLYS